MERELEIVRLHAPELDEGLARRLVEIVHMVRQLDLKKPPSIAESIDWARTLLLIGADDIDRETFESSMSILVKHRSDIDLVAERVAVKLEGDGVPALHTARLDRSRACPRPRRSLLAFFEELRSEGVAVGTSEILDAFAALDEVSWTDQRDFRESLAATIAKSQEDRRIFELLFDRHFFRAAESEALERGIEDERFEGAGDRIDLDELREAIRRAIIEGNDGEMRDLARLAMTAFGRQGERSGVIGVDVQRIRRALGLQASGRRDDGDGAGARPRERPAVRALPAPRAGAGDDRAHRQAAALAAARRARPHAADQPGPGPGRGPPRGRPAQAADRHPRPRAARPQPGPARSTSAARCGPRSRPAACRCGCATGRSGRGGPRSTSSATSPPR